MDFSKFDQQRESEFGLAEEEAIVSLILDYPEAFVPLAKFVTSDLFQSLAPKYIIEMLKQEFDKYGNIPSRPLFRDKVAKTLDVDDPYEEILGLVERKSDPRDVARIRDRLQDWIKHQTLGLLYNDQALDAHARGDYEYLEGIFNDATRISVSCDQGLWFFDQIEELLADNVLEHIDTGFKQLNAALNEGGPSPGEVLVWLAPTGVGKCHSLQSKIIEKDLSRIYKLELEDGKVIKLAGYRKIQTERGEVKVCDLAEDDIITDIPNFEDVGDIFL